MTDLGSANQTMVNDKAIQESILQLGDRISIGDTVIRVLNNIPVNPTPEALSVQGPIVDLGLAAPKENRPGLKKLGREQLILVLCLVTALAIAAWVWKYYNGRPLPSRPPATVLHSYPKTLEIDYEKIEATPENIFRYKLALSRNRVLSVQIDDILNNRHLADEKILGSNVVADLIQYMQESGFSSLKEEYQGVLPSSLNLWDLSITLGKKVSRTVVRNHVEPDLFKSVREKVEVFGKNELGLWAMQFPPEKIIKMAEEAFVLAKKLYEQKEIKSENLSMAITNLKRAHMDLRSIEPKPSFYAESLTLLSDCKQKLQEKYEENNFQSSRALNLKDWETAANHLRMILELIPDQDDSRHQEARKILLEVEERQRSKKK